LTLPAAPQQAFIEQAEGDRQRNCQHVVHSGGDAQAMGGENLPGNPQKAHGYAISVE
jgi:hypothetical protein